LLGELRAADLRCSCAELVELALWMLRLAAAAIPERPEALLAAMLTNRAALASRVDRRWGGSPRAEG
jgi:hypothetical protein